MSDEPPPSSVTLACAAPLTVTVKLQVELTPVGAVAVQLTVAVPVGKAEPDGGTHAITVPTGLPVMSGEGKATTARHSPASA
jgi:hypothetical protein